MGRTVYLPTWMVGIYGFHVGKYTIPMDGMFFFQLKKGNDSPSQPKTNVNDISNTSNTVFCSLCVREGSWDVVYWVVALGIYYLPVTVQKNMKVNILTWKISASCGDEKSNSLHPERRWNFQGGFLQFPTTGMFFFKGDWQPWREVPKYISHWKEKEGTSSTSSKVPLYSSQQSSF